MTSSARKAKQPGRAPARARPKRSRARTARGPLEAPPVQQSVPAGSIAVQIKFMGDLPTVIGQRMVHLCLPAENTVADLLAVLSQTYGEAFTSRVFQAPGKLHHYILLFVDGVKVPGNSSGWSQTLGNGEVDVVMLPMFGGG